MRKAIFELKNIEFPVPSSQFSEMMGPNWELETGNWELVCFRHEIRL
jgi:hypothetical protein